MPVTLLKDTNGYAYIGVVDANGTLAVPSLTYVQTPGGLYLPASATNPMPTQAPDVTAALANMNALNNAAQIALAGANSVSVVLTGTWVGTLVPEISIDGGTTWLATNFYNPNTQALVASVTALGSYSIVGTGGASHARVRLSAYTSGTVTGTLRASSQAPDVVATQVIGSNTQSPGDGIAPNPSPLGTTSFLEGYNRFTSLWERLTVISGAGGLLPTPTSGTQSVAITISVTTAVKASAGVVGTITNSDVVTSGVITIYDNTGASGKKVWSGTLTAGQVLPLGIPCGTGITVTTAAGNPITVTYA